jgi:hypothetical protein
MLMRIYEEDDRTLAYLNRLPLRRLVKDPQVSPRPGRPFVTGMRKGVKVERT